MEEEKIEQTFGQKAVGFSFNPGGDPKVNEVKKLYAAVIDSLVSIPVDHSPAMDKLIQIAIKEAQGAQMWAVKAITWKD